MSKIAIIVLVYNGRNYLPDLLSSLRSQNYPQEFCEIILVDNASSDGSVEYIKTNFSEFTLIQNQNNEGFAKGNNIGIKYALKREFDYIVLLNQDTAVEPNWLKEIIEGAEKDERIAAVQPLILFWNVKDKINSSGNQVHFLGFGFCEGFNFNVKDGQSEKKEIFYSSGAGVLFKAKVLKEAGLFDENLFYTEDLDLGWRIRLAGYEIINAPKAVIYHKYSFSRNKNKYYFLEFGRLFTILKNYQITTIFLILPLLIFWETGITIYSFWKGWGVLKLKSYKDLFLRLPLLIKERKKIKRRISDKEISKFIRGKIDIDCEDFKNPIFRLINPFLNLYWQLVKFFISL